MSYMALYRKFRPSEFEEVKGQEHIVTTLQNQIKANRIGHAYLFCGTRGTGKTTVAKIFAKAVNCENPVDGSPCGECAMCRSIGAGTSMNVIEIDAASNNGVDNIREIKEEVAYRPTEGKYKVYIIDEVHMLSIGAFNALLKTLEEPPAYVIFILATTEVHKIPITILSRCQRYDFRRITTDTIADRMRDLTMREQVEVEEKALRYIAKAADGSMRDALSLLDQCIAFYLGQKLTYEHVLEVLGAVDTDVFSRLYRTILKADVCEALETVEELMMQGRELTQLTVDFTWYLRNILMIKTSGHAEDMLEVSAENLKQLKEEAEMSDVNALFRYIRIFSEASGQMKYAAQKRILLEVTLIKLCTPAMEATSDSLVERIRVLEDKLENGQVVISGSEDTPGNHFGSKNESVSSKQEDTPPLIPTAIPEDIRQVVKMFPTIRDELGPPDSFYLKNAKLSLGRENHLLIMIRDAIGAEAMQLPEHKNRLEELIQERIGKKVEVEIHKADESRPVEHTFIDLEKIINMEIIVED